MRSDRGWRNASGRPLPAQSGTLEEDALFCLATRLVRPLNWLGLVEQKHAPRLAPIATGHLRKTALFDKFLRIKMPRSNLALFIDTLFKGYKRTAAWLRQTRRCAVVGLLQLPISSGNVFQFDLADFRSDLVKQWSKDPFNLDHGIDHLFDNVSPAIGVAQPSCFDALAMRRTRARSDVIQLSSPPKEASIASFCCSKNENTA